MRKILGIRREDVNKWERRAPLTPDAAVKGKKKVRLKFQAHPEATAGGVFAVRVLKK